MAFGLQAPHTQNIFKNDLSTEQLLALAILTAQQFGWNISYVSRNGFLANTHQEITKYKADITFRIIHGIASVTCVSSNQELFDWGKNKNTVMPFIDAMEIKKSYQQKEELDNYYQNMIDSFQTHLDEKLMLPPPSRISILKGFIAIFKPSENYVVTPIFIDINIIVFLLMIISGVDIMEPSGESLIQWGANYSPLTLEGQWWRLLSCCFIHIGIIHLLMNMYALLYIGILLEPLLGKARLITAYLLTGIIASFTSLWWHDITNSAGASGAIFGLYGVFLALLTTQLVEKDTRKTLISSIGIFVIYNLLSGMKGGVDNAAHIGGLVSGFAIGYAMLPSLKRNNEPRISLMTIGLLTFITLVTAGLIYSRMPNTVRIYEAKMKTFSDLELKTIGIDTVDRHSRKDIKLSEIKDKGIASWTTNRTITEDISKLKLPKEMLDKNNLLKKYSELRLKSLNLMYKSVEENSSKYDIELNTSNQDMENIIQELNKPVPLVK